MTRTMVVTSGVQDVDRRGPRGFAVLAYAAVFALVLPALLLAWMVRLDTLLVLPRLFSPGAGVALATAGAAMIVAGVASLWRLGGGLPMSPFPPERLVSRGIYAVVRDPIYIGAALACAGVAVAIGSASGIWIVTPLFAAAMAAFVAGYERDATVRRFGPLPRPWLSIPEDEADTAWAPTFRSSLGRAEARVRFNDRLSVYVLVIAPWILMYLAVEHLGIPPDARSTYLPGEPGWPVLPWTEAVYFIAYPLVLLAPLLARERGHLRRFALDGLAATASIIPFYLLVPLVAAPRPIPLPTAWAPLLQLERSGVPAVAAFPAFHVVWACIAARMYAARWPRLRAGFVVLALCIGAACVSAGMHSVTDVLAGFGAYLLLRERGRLWRWVCGLTERVANSWREKTVGPIRFLNHGIYPAAGTLVGVAVATALAGRDAFWWLVGMAVAAELGAGAWAQIVEGSSLLLRPYGYFGGVIGVVAVAPIAAAAGVDPWRLLAAIAAGGCVTQAFGRLRCLVQGCCHGHEIDVPWGISYRHPRSRVLRLSALGHRPLHPTPLYSILWTLAVFAVLVRAWTLAAPLPFIAGAYLILVGLGRFVEEHFRGEPQTAWVAGLRLYQWLAIAFVLAGAAMTTIAGAPAPPPERLAGSMWPTLALLGGVTYVAFGVDFPGSNRRFSRLV